MKYLVFLSISASFLSVLEASLVPRFALENDHRARDLLLDPDQHSTMFTRTPSLSENGDKWRRHLDYFPDNLMPRYIPDEDEVIHNLASRQALDDYDFAQLLSRSKESWYPGIDKFPTQQHGPLDGSHSLSSSSQHHFPGLHSSHSSSEQFPSHKPFADHLPHKKQALDQQASTQLGSQDDSSLPLSSTRYASSNSSPKKQYPQSSSQRSLHQRATHNSYL